MRFSSSVVAYLSLPLYHLCHQVSRQFLIARSVCAMPVLTINPSAASSIFLAFATLHRGMVQAVLGAALRFVRSSATWRLLSETSNPHLFSYSITSLAQPNPSIERDRRDNAAPAPHVKR